jgi:hypothetical protein
MPRGTPQPGTASAEPISTTPPAAPKSRPTKQRRKGRRSTSAALTKQFEARVAAEVQRRLSDANLHRPQTVVDARSFPLGQDRPRDLPVDGPARLTPPEIEPVTGVFSKEYLDELRFMEESVTVRVQPTPDKNADPCPGVWVNGRSQYFPRGVAITCKRKFVEQLARSRTTNFTQEEFTDTKGYKAIRNNPSTSLNFPFQLMRDDNPNGVAWLEKILSEA